MSRIRVEKYTVPEAMEYSVSLESDKARVKYAKRIEQIIRSSLEYRDYIAYLKEYVDMAKCAFFTGVQSGQGNKVRIEVHHEPLTLFDIVIIVMNKYQQEGIPLDDLYIAEEVMRLHYENKVGLIPLSKSIHQIVHHGEDIIIPLSLVYGNYKEFIEEYYDYINNPDDVITTAIVAKIEQKIIATRNITSEMIDKLTPSFVYIEIDGYKLPQKVAVEETA